MRILCIGASLTAGWTTKDGSVLHPYGTRLQERLPKGTEVHISGISGEETSDIQLRLEQLLADAQRQARPYALVILLAGTSDVCKDKGSAEIVDNLIAMSNMVLTCNETTHIIHITLPEIARPIPGSHASRRGGPIQVTRLQVNEALRLYVDAVQRAYDEDEGEKEKDMLSRVSLCDLAVAIPQYPLPRTNYRDRVEEVVGDRGVDEEEPTLHSFWDSDKVHLSCEGYDFFADLLFEHIRQILPVGSLETEATETATVTTTATANTTNSLSTLHDCAPTDLLHSLLALPTGSAASASASAASASASAADVIRCNR